MLTLDLGDGMHAHLPIWVPESANKWFQSQVVQGGISDVDFPVITIIPLQQGLFPPEVTP